MAAKNGRFFVWFIYKESTDLWPKNSQNVLVAAICFAILPNCQYPKPNCALRARHDALTALWILVREEGGSKLFDFSYHICRKIPLLWKFYNNGVSTFGQFWWCEITPSMEFVMQCEYCWVLLESVCISSFAIIEFSCFWGTKIINSVTITVDNDSSSWNSYIM